MRKNKKLIILNFLFLCLFMNSLNSYAENTEKSITEFYDFDFDLDQDISFEEQVAFGEQLEVTIMAHKQ